MKRGFSKIGFMAALVVSAFGSAGVASAQQFNWDGFYAGVEGGLGHGSSDMNHLGDTFTPTGPGPFVPDTTPGGPTDPKLSGGLFGAHIGFMRQMNGLVLGLDGAWDWTNIKGTTHRANPDGSTPDFDVAVDSLAMINGRVGVANGRWLAYATGGVAVASVKAKVSGGDGAGGTFENRDTGQTHVGWDAGAGLSYAATDSILIGLEYDHVDLGNKDHKLTDVNNPAGYAMFAVDPQIDVVKARLSFKFGAREPEHEPLK